jgi:predicted nucleic acid-binding protein
VDKVVIDAGPFIHLHQIGHLNLLKRLPSLLVPVSVLSELSVAGRHRPLQAIGRWPNLKAVAVRDPLSSPRMKRIGRMALQRGELDCLSLACERQPVTLLTDDLAARTAAERLGIDVHGTVGLIAYGVRRQWLSVQGAQEALERLYHQSSLFVTYAIIERAIRLLKESVQH